VEEIGEWAENAAELKQHVNILTLSADKLSENPEEESSKATRILEKLGYRGQSGWATSQLLDTLQQTHDVVYDHHRPLPLPSSFLLDENGNLRAVYKGPVSSNRILQDVKTLATGQPAEHALPFAGRWMAPLGSHNLQLLVEELFREGYQTEAQAYVERLTDERFQTRLVGARLFLSQQLATSDPAAAMRHAKDVLQVAPNEAKAHERLGLLYARSGKAAEAKHHFTQAIRHQTKPEARTHYNFGKLLRSARSTPGAWEQFSKALTADPKFDLAYEQLGLIRASQRQFAEAAELFAKAVAIQPSTPSYRVNQAMALTQLNRNADAWEAIQPIVAQPDVPPMALLLGARSLGNLKQFSEAIPLLERFLEKEPGAADVRKQLQLMREKVRTQ